MDLRIVTIVRTLNEERNIARFLRGYVGWVDQVLVADGGSEDRTVEIANRFPRTQVREFHEYVTHERGTRRNPHGKHIQFLVDWALEEGAGWILFDDCDCVPNWRLRKYGRRLLTETTLNVAFAVRLYLWGHGPLHFPKLAQVGGDGKWTPSLWGWRADARVQVVDDDWHTKLVYPTDRRLDIYPPYCLLHRPWPDEEEVDRKTKFYHGAQLPHFEHPLKFGGPLADLPEWAVEVNDES